MSRCSPTSRSSVRRETTVASASSPTPMSPMTAEPVLFIVLQPSEKTISVCAWNKGLSSREMCSHVQSMTTEDSQMKSQVTHTHRHRNTIVLVQDTYIYFRLGKGCHFINKLTPNRELTPTSRSSLFYHVQTAIYIRLHCNLYHCL